MKTMDFKVYSLKNIDYLGRIIQEMKGDVFLRIGSNRPMNLTKDSEGLEVLRRMKIGSTGVVLSISDPADTDSMVAYLIGR